MLNVFVLSLALMAEDPKIQYQPGNAALKICGVSASEPVKIVEKILALPNTSLVEQTGEYLTLSQEKEMRLWTLAINDHPAAPAIICRTFKPDGKGGSHLTMEIACFVQKTVCDKLASDFAAHDRGVINRATSQ